MRAAPQHISAIGVARGVETIWVGHNDERVQTSRHRATPTWTAAVAARPDFHHPGRVIDQRKTQSTSLRRLQHEQRWRPPTADSGHCLRVGHDCGGSVAISPSGHAPSWLYAATEVGLFTSQDGGSTWSVPGDGPANVSIEELFWMGPSLVAVTHGRGLFSATPSTAPVPPVITWPNPAAIAVGTALSATQLNASTTTAGTFVYSPPAGTQLGVGNGQQLSVTFTPTDTLNDSTATASVAIDGVEDHAGDHLADTVADHRWNGVERNAAECDHAGGGYVCLHSGPALSGAAGNGRMLS